MGIFIKRKLNNSEIEAIPRLLKRHPQLLIYSEALSFSEYTKYFVASTRYFLNQNKKSYLLVKKNSKTILGMTLLRFMEWDSKFFKRSIGCIEYILVDENQKNKETDNLERELLKKGIDLARELGMGILYISMSSVRHSLINSLNSLRFDFLSGEIKGLVRERDISYLLKKKKRNGQYKFRRYKKDDYLQVIKIAEEITKDVDSKFSLTRYLPREERQSYYLENIKNCCLGRNADDMFVAIRNRDVIGFLCYRYNRIFEKASGRKMSFLVMGGVCRNERRKKVGANLFVWAHKQIFKKSGIISWKIYLHNLPIMKFILRRGFMPPIEIVYTFCRKL